jgi:hypothetical protein
MEPELLASLLASVATDSLVIVCGAGLSRTEPSRVPAAADLATSCARRFTQSTGMAVPEDAELNLEALAELFFRNPIFWRLFLEQLVEWGPFVRGPNAGHIAIADFLCSGAVRFVLTTNFDTLIESAAEAMGEPLFRAALDGDGMQVHHAHRPVLKLHGCARVDQQRTVWCRTQYDQNDGDATTRERLQSSQAWLNANLRGCHILIVGFWSDWPHFNDALTRALQGHLPASITLVDISNDEQLRLKAPDLWRVAEPLGPSFRRTRASGAEFLNELRIGYSLRFLQRVLVASIATYKDLGGANDDPAPVLPAGLSADELYDLRRDICGVAPTEIVRDHTPTDSMRGVGAVHLLVQEKGSRFLGSRYRARDGATIRVVNGASDSLHRVKARFSKGQTASDNGETVICAATIADGGVPSDIVRANASMSDDVVRPGTQARWLNFEMARAQDYC